MDLTALRGRVLAANLAVHGVSATVTRPAPDNTPVTLTGIWLVPFAEEEMPHGRDFPRREPRRLFAIPKSALSGCPRNTLIVAAESRTGATSQTWRVDGFERSDADHWRVVLVPAA
jgi:hypothetical protein